MTRLAWNEAGTRLFETGLDRGVLYLKSPEAYLAGILFSSSVGPGDTTNFPIDYRSGKMFKVGQAVKIYATADTTQFYIGTITDQTYNTLGAWWDTKVLLSEVNHTVDPLDVWKVVLVHTAVSWNGLTGVDEDGAESAASYYIDGRPFLFLPKPKEFSATIKAYTYPDEFAQIQGLEEATPGMFLDSQQADAFDLCYRTKIGNDLEGIDYAYKIHIVYNAIVVPQNIGYQTLSNDINPNEFSWQIQAVPVLVEGYRPTAHIVIDTRSMDPDKLSALEDILYGTSTDEAFLPDPQTIFDTLTYGDAIIITDLGDGTWTAEGSYKNVYMIGDGVFQIDNVNAVDHGDGTYTISSTP